MTAVKAHLVALSCFLLFSLQRCRAGFNPIATASLTRNLKTRCFDAMDSDAFFSSERPVGLSPDDIERLSKIRNRQKTLPLLICQDSLLPGQTFELASVDDKFQSMCRTIQVNDELALVGMHPHKKGEPLTVGVTAIVEEKTSTVLKVKALEVADVQGQPWWDSNKSCFVTNLELAEDDLVLKGRHYQQAKQWFDELPSLVRKWRDAMGRDVTTLHTQSSTDFTGRALCVAALLNPSRPFKSPVCLEIRPALLVCRNDYDRLYLVYAAMQASLQHLRGTDPLF